jgi:hypothetical protein
VETPVVMRCFMVLKDLSMSCHIYLKHVILEVQHVKPRQTRVFFMVSKLSSSTPTRLNGSRRGRAVNSHSGGARFEFRLGHQLSWLKIFMVFLSSSRQKSGYYLDQATTASLQISIHLPSIHSTLPKASLNNSQINKYIG